MAEIITQAQFKTRIAECFNITKLSRMNQEYLNERLNKFVRHEVARKVGTVKPRMVYSLHTQGFVSGVIQVYSDCLFQKDLEFCYKVDGVLYSTHKESVHRSTEEFYQRKAGHELGKQGVFSGFYWKGTDQLYFGSEK